MVNGAVATSRYSATHYTLHSVLNHIIYDSTKNISENQDSFTAESSSSVLEHGERMRDTAVCSEVLVVCGTLYAMPQVRRALGIIEPK